MSGLNWPHLLRVSKAQKELKRKERKEKGTVKEKKRTERGHNMSWKRNEKEQGRRRGSGGSALDRVSVTAYQSFDHTTCHLCSRLT